MTDMNLTQEDIELTAMVNNHSDAARRNRRKTETRDHIFLIWTYILYVLAFAVLLWGAGIAVTATLIAPIVCTVVRVICLACGVYCLCRLVVVLTNSRS